MTLDEAIKHAEEVASKRETDTDWGMGNHFIDRSGVADVIECGKEHRQLAEWLKDYKRLKEKAEPEMVIYYGDGYADGEIVYDGAQCPNCGMDFEESDSDWEEPYCHYCGQALKWEEEG